MWIVLCGDWWGIAMFDEVRLVDVMAESLGIKRIKGEGNVHS